MHQDIVTTVPKGATNLGSSPTCEIQGLYIPQRVLSLQAHPEFSEAIMDDILRRRHDQKIITDEVYTSAMGRAGNSHDGFLTSKVVWKFLFGEL